MALGYKEPLHHVGRLRPLTPPTLPLDVDSQRRAGCHTPVRLTPSMRETDGLTILSFGPLLIGVLLNTMLYGVRPLR